MTKSLDIEATAAAARALLDERVTSVTELAKTRQRVNELRDQLAAAELDDARAYTAATSKGWTSAELLKVGLAEPSKVQRVRKRSASKSPAAAAPVQYTEE